MKKICSNCELELTGWIYYEYGKIKLCRFCYKMMGKVENEE